MGRLTKALWVLLPYILFVHLAMTQDWTLWEGAQGAPRLRAQFRDKDQNARNRIAAVEVEVQNVWLNYPNPVRQQGIQAAVLEYRLDSCPTILTTETRLRFANLKSGAHTINVHLVAGNRIVSPDARLQVNIP